jgi:hypothetical protein
MSSLISTLSNISQSETNSESQSGSLIPSCGSDDTNMDRNSQTKPYGCQNISNSSMSRENDYRNATVSNYVSDLVNDPLAAETAVVNKQLSQININSNKVQHANELLQLSADKNNESLKKLKEFEKEIATKNRMVQINKDEHLKRIGLIKSIIVVFIILCVAFLPLALALGNVISKTMFVVYFVLICVVGFFIFVWMNNMFYIRDYFTFTKSGIGGAIDQASSTLQSWEESVSNSVSSRINNFNQIVVNDVYGEQNKWIKNNCTCPEEENITNDNFPIPFSTSGELVWPEPGFYYDDGTAPNQLLVPNNTAANSKFQFKEKIKWPSYSRSVKNNNNSIIPRRLPKDEADDRLVGNTTNTRNL